MKLNICSSCYLIVALVPWILIDCKRIMLADDYETRGFLGKKDPHSMLLLKFREKVINPVNKSKTDAINKKNSPAFAKHLGKSRRLLSMLVRNHIINNLTSTEKTVEDIKVYLTSLNRTAQLSNLLVSKLRDPDVLRLCNSCIWADVGSVSSMLTSFLTKLVNNSTTQQFALVLMSSVVEAFLGQVFEELFKKVKEKKSEYPSPDKDTGDRFYYY